MRKAVRLAVEARDRFLKEQSDADADHNTNGHRQTRSVKIALSLGPFGATLSPAQEFNGFYPPPFGPKAYSPTGPNTNAFADSIPGGYIEARHAAAESLATFHLARLAVFAEDPGVWDAIDFIAFETVPLTTEIIAIRKAVDRMHMGFPALDAKPWWISTVYPNGQFPEEVASGDGRVSVRDVTLALYGNHELCGEAIREGNKNATALPLPTGIGVNCTTVDALQGILMQITNTIKGLQREDGTRPAPFLVVYPNRGDIFDVVERTWTPSRNDGAGGEWARRLWDVVCPFLMESNSVWQGSIIGGCCKVGPKEIAALVKEVRATSGDGSD